ncbi:MAG: hypothetical protein GVY12_03345 [Bacteroidetes bacterium]|nr:hypothetical protein [Bacteroidota bacterium]
MAALLTGQSVSQVAKAYEIPKGTVSNWKRKAWEGAGDGFGAAGGQPREQTGALLLDYLRASLKALRLQAELFADEEWLQKQTTAEVAILHGLMTDKALGFWKRWKAVGWMTNLRKILLH